MIGPWIIYKAGSFTILVDTETKDEIGQLSCTDREAAIIMHAPEMLLMIENIGFEIFQQGVSGDQELLSKIQTLIGKIKLTENGL